MSGHGVGKEYERGELVEVEQRDNQPFELASVASSAYYRVTMEHKSGVFKSQVFRVEVSEIDPFIIYNGEEYPGTSLVLPQGASFSLYAKPTSILSQSVNSTRIYKWAVANDTIQADTLTYHWMIWAYRWPI